MGSSHTLRSIHSEALGSFIFMWACVWANKIACRRHLPTTFYSFSKLPAQPQTDAANDVTLICAARALYRPTNSDMCRTRSGRGANHVPTHPIPANTTPMWLWIPGSGASRVPPNLHSVHVKRVRRSTEFVLHHFGLWPMLVQCQQNVGHFDVGIFDHFRTLVTPFQPC